MSSVFRWLLRIFAGVVLFCVLAVASVYWIAARSIPDYSATHNVVGLTGPVQIVRDNSSIPHIFGKSDRDVFFGLGFAHAQDRLWQMMTMRRTVQGRLSEIFGEATVSTDELMRRLDLYSLAVSSVDALEPATRTALDSYSAGVNAWIGQVNEGALGRGAPEFFIFPSAISPWQAADSVAIGKLMAVQMASHMSEEILLARTSLLLPPERVRDIIPDFPGNGITELPEYSGLFDNSTMFAAALPPRISDLLSPFKPRLLAGASNAWAAAPSRSATTSTLLANDPHLGFSAPAIWYLARLELSTGGVIGGTIPGIPSVLVGRSDLLGWGLTSAYADDQDIFIEQLNPENPDEVLTPDGFRPLRQTTSIIRIKDADPKTITLKWSRNGPIIPGSFFGLATVTPPDHLAALGWTMLVPNDTSLDFGIKLMQSTTVQQAIEAGASHVAPANNLMLADQSSVAMKTVGALPRRGPGHQSQGRLPVPGWNDANIWRGAHSYSSNPEFTDPIGGLLGNTNNKILDRPFPLHVSFAWGDTQRIERWRRLMQLREVHTRDSFVEAQLDTVSFTARSLLPLIAAELWFSEASAPEGTSGNLRKRALDLLAEWNGEMNEHLPEPLIYAAWIRALQERLIRDDLGPLAREFNQVEPLFIERVFRDIDGASDWCDIIQSAPVETCSDISRQALDDALVWISDNFGTSIESLRWGDMHQATHDHATLGGVAVLSYFVNIRQSTSGGNNTLQRGRTSGQGANPFLNVHGAGYRGVYDFADPDSSVFVTSTGQSGHFLSRHYDDLGALWRRGEYIPMSLDADLARAAAVGVTELFPVDSE